MAGDEGGGDQRRVSVCVVMNERGKQIKVSWCTCHLY